MKRLLSSLLIAFGLAVAPASANIIYTFAGLTFDDNGTLTGTFETNDAINSLLGFDITTSGGAAVGFHYTNLTADSSSTSLPFILVLSKPLQEHLLQVTFDALDASGSAVTIGQFSSFEQSGTVHRNITGGEVVVGAVPEPATLALVALGVVGLLISVGRRREA